VSVYPETSAAYPSSGTMEDYPAMASGRAPRVRSRWLNSSTAACKSSTVKSGQRLDRKTNSAKAHSQSRKFGEALLAASADEQVDVSGSAAQHFGKYRAERFLREFGHFVEAAGGVVDGIASGVVDGQTQVQARSAGGGRFRVDDGLAKSGGNAIAAANDAQADAFVDAVRGFGQKIFVEDAQNSGDFRWWPLPIGGRQCKKCERVDAETWRRFDDCACGLSPGAMPRGARQAASSGPAAIAVGDDRDVNGARRRHVSLEARAVLRERLVWGKISDMSMVCSPPLALRSLGEPGRIACGCQSFTNLKYSAIQSNWAKNFAL